MMSGSRRLSVIRDPIIEHNLVGSMKFRIVPRLEKGITHTVVSGVPAARRKG